MSTKRWLLSAGLVTTLVLVLFAFYSSGASADNASRVRWDIISLQPPNVLPGGVASARADDGAMMTITGRGTFVAAAREGGATSAATGGGTWETRDKLNNVTGSGTYQVTGLVRWVSAPGTPPPVNDLIGEKSKSSAGLAVLTVKYSDGDFGVLVVSCHLVGSPDTIFEGINASKGFVHYYDNIAPVAGVDANRTLFHIDQ